ncbi:hypothetical protein [Formosa algae]|uniref:Secretion system C-terminal sorting domain-containing protein n=1 Tax=Formosa algae TaxID=225843 RepID=A0A9X0YHB0_9FLAO|nr:hypothetical protein [Formosa algae]MBP1838507.1 hypothetical protein [Formosa algae]MDQ0335007.1 hypothetical protein [Formosa algae]OEI79651.1 hypothetical protein AST99_13860 [Formosa algae]PNW30209.1 hypothetical protein BKP44_00710 [Formosa algae]
MKKIMTLSICLLVAATSFASDFAKNTSSNFDGRKDKEITLTLDNVKEGQQLYIKDIKGFVLYNKTFTSTGSVKNTFDFSTLPNGVYFFEHEKAYQVKVIPFNVNNGEVKFSPNEKVIYKPVVKANNNSVFVSKLQLDKKDVTVSILFENGSNFEVIHKENFTNTANIQRAYNLSKKAPGNYKVIVKANGREFVDYFSI